MAFNYARWRKQFPFLTPGFNESDGAEAEASALYQNPPPQQQQQSSPTPRTDFLPAPPTTAATYAAPPQDTPTQFLPPEWAGGFKDDGRPLTSNAPRLNVGFQDNPYIQLPPATTQDAVPAQDTPSVQNTATRPRRVTEVGESAVQQERRRNQAEHDTPAARTNPQGFKARFVDFLKGAGRGAILGAAEGGIGGALGGAVYGGARQAIKHDFLGGLQKQEDVARSDAQLAQLEAQTDKDLARKQTETNIANIGEDNTRQREELAARRVERQQTAADRAYAQLRSRMNSRNVFDPKTLTPTDRALLKDREGWTDEQIDASGHDFSNPVTRTVAGQTFQFNRATGKFEATDLPVDETRRAEAQTVEFKIKGQTYVVGQARAAAMTNAQAVAEFGAAQAQARQEDSQSEGRAREARSRAEEQEDNATTELRRLRELHGAATRARANGDPDADALLQEANQQEALIRARYGRVKNIDAGIRAAKGQ